MSMWYHMHIAWYNAHVLRCLLQVQPKQWNFPIIHTNYWLIMAWNLGRLYKVYKAKLETLRVNDVYINDWYQWYFTWKCPYIKWLNQNFLSHVFILHKVLLYIWTHRNLYRYAPTSHSMAYKLMCFMWPPNSVAIHMISYEYHHYDNMVVIW